jgi:hypothetical protein
MYVPGVLNPSLEGAAGSAAPYIHLHQHHIFTEFTQFSIKTMLSAYAREEIKVS